jgi:hypothetical protein
VIQNAASPFFESVASPTGPQGHCYSHTGSKISVPPMARFSTRNPTMTSTKISITVIPPFVWISIACCKRRARTCGWNESSGAVCSTDPSLANNVLLSKESRHRKIGKLADNWHRTQPRLRCIVKILFVIFKGSRFKSSSLPNVEPD